ncbi:MAG: RNA polymerase subunit sigma-24 [Chloroflexi bacterium]|nr:RNA polymerase subunit sigma-24 [Chloroflexota bacterium]MDL1884867.1 sigma-70 family RNA polymerase sigma factor [Anaerolineae bacterium CFX8]
MKPALQDEQTLIAALKRRDPAALSALFEAHADKIYRLAAGMLRDEQQADGVVQNTFLALIKHIDHFEGRSDIGTWLYRVGYNECLMRLRRVRPEVELDEDAEPDRMPASFTDWSTMPDALLDSAEAAGEMERAIASLKPELRAVFLLRDVDELSTAETARILSISESLVKVRLHRARLALREKLAAYFDERAQA